VWARHWNPSALVPRVRWAEWVGGEWLITISSAVETRVVHAFEVYKLDAVSALAHA
jgi:hypothetical protein